VAGSGRNSIVVAVGSPIAPADLPKLCAGVRARIERSGAAVVVIDLGAVAAPDAVTVDAMARLALTAKRLGCEVQVCDVPRVLRELLDLSGLGGLGGSPLEVQRQTEEWKDAFDIEEERELDDPSV
jgi:anti-anti-sigma regulatory factor